MQNIKTFLFLPEVGIYPYFRTLLTTADCISSNKDVIVLHCTGQLDTCSTLASVHKQLSEKEKSEYCKSCQQCYKDAKKKYHFTGIELSEIVTPDRKENLNGLIPSELEKCYDYKYKDFSVGKIAVYNLVLETKILDIYHLSEEHFALLKQIMLNIMIALEITEYVCDKCNPQLLLTFNPYSQCQAAKFIANKRGIKYKCLTNVPHMGADYSKYYFSKEFLSTDFFDICQKWPEYSHKSITSEAVKASWDDALFRFYGSGSHIFSQAKSKTPDEILKQLHLQPNKKTLIAFTSSNDEYIGMNIFFKTWGITNTSKDAFPSTLEWLKFLEKYAQNNKDIQIIVRVHPREGKRQYGKPSEHLLMLQKEFTSNSDNFVIVWSDDPISSYDLLELADLVLVTLSTMSIECARVGIPFLSSCSGRYFANGTFMQVADSVEEYEKKLTQLVNVDFSYEKLRDAIRYNFWRNFILSVDFGETVPHGFTNRTIWPKAPKSVKQDVRNICLDEISVLDYNINKWNSEISDNSEQQEKVEIMLGIQRMVNTVMLPRPKYNRLFSFILKVYSKIMYKISSGKNTVDQNEILTKTTKIVNPKFDFANAQNSKCALIGFPEKNVISYQYQDTNVQRYSPLLYRLLKIYQDLQNK